MMFGLKKSEISIIRNVIEGFSEIKRAVIFGSRAKGTQKDGSDIDIAVIGNGITNDSILKLKNILEEETNLPYFFDVVHYETIKNNDLKGHIDRRGQEIYSRREI